jgi:hypothetical protein
MVLIFKTNLLDVNFLIKNLTISYKIKLVVRIFVARVDYYIIIIDTIINLFLNLIAFLAINKTLI